MSPPNRAPLPGGRVQREQHGESQVRLHARLLGAGERRGGERGGLLLAAAPVRRFHLRSLSGGGGPEIRGGCAGEGGGEEDSRGEQRDRRPQRSHRVQVCYPPQQLYPLGMRAVCYVNNRVEGWTSSGCV